MSSLQCSQARIIISLLPISWTDERVLAVVMFWSRTIDRKENWSNVIIQSLLPQEQIRVCQTLGYFNTFNEFDPEMSYQLRMHRPDEYKVIFFRSKSDNLGVLEVFKENFLDFVKYANVSRILRDISHRDLIAKIHLNLCVHQ